jgi:hypothetical protein
MTDQDLEGKKVRWTRSDGATYEATIVGVLAVKQLVQIKIVEQHRERLIWVSETSVQPLEES